MPPRLFLDRLRFLPALTQRTTVNKPVNETQRRFAELSALGGGLKGGPVRSKVLDLIQASGQSLNASAYLIAKRQFETHAEDNPWYVCFAIGLAWGRLAKLEDAFTGHVVNVLKDWNQYDLSAASSFYLERGPEPIEKSLMGAHNLFSKVTLPATLPNTLEGLSRAEERWFSPILSPARPPFIGSWNATAMFMAALFAQPSLAKTQRVAKPILPPGGPITAGLKMLHAAHILNKPPGGNELDDQAFEPGALYLNNALFVELVNDLPDACVLDIHSGIYLLGTRDPQSDGWF